MQNLFNQIEVRTPGTSTFDLSHDLKTTLKMGVLIPILNEDCLPGDKWQLSSESLFRMMPMVAPIMHKIDIYVHYWFVPWRTLWPNFETFITGGEELGTAPPAMPYIDFTGLVGGIEPSSLANYLGLPASTTLAVFNREIRAFDFAAYQAIYHWFYRDQNLQAQDLDDIMLVDGDNTPARAVLTAIKRRAWEHDYFTSCLPYAQKGAPVEIPLQLTGLTIEAVQPGTGGATAPQIRDNASGLPAAQQPLQVFSAAGLFANTTQSVYYDPNGSLAVDSSTASTLTTINDLRTATAIQKFLEKNMRAGSRYSEFNLAVFGRKTQDYRLQQPEYLGGSKSTMAISEVLQTSESAGTPQANMAGHGISVNGGSDCFYDVPEHGTIMGIMSIMPKTAYYSGVPKKFLKFDKYDFALPDFAHLGEQEVKQIELVYQGGPDDEDTFGYLPRYTEYRVIPSRVNGEMADTLQYWHLGRDLEQGVPVPLNDEFITCEPSNRIFAVISATDNIVAHIFHSIRCNRPLPLFGTPGSI